MRKVRLVVREPFPSRALRHPGSDRGTPAQGCPRALAGARPQRGVPSPVARTLQGARGRGTYASWNSPGPGLALALLRHRQLRLALALLQVELALGLLLARLHRLGVEGVEQHQR